MTISTLSSKNQTTLSVEFVKLLKLFPGMRLKQWVEGNRIILEPVDDISTAYGALHTNIKFTYIKEEPEAAERGMAEDAMNGMKN